MDKIYVEYFYHRHTEFWKNQALKKLPALVSATEYAGLRWRFGNGADSVPEGDAWTGNTQSWNQRIPKNQIQNFAMPADAPYLSVCTTSTRYEPIRAWWEEKTTIDPAFLQSCFENSGSGTWKMRCADCRKSLTNTCILQPCWLFYPWQDWMAMDNKLCLKTQCWKRINVPVIPRNFWCYRIHFDTRKIIERNSIRR